LLFVFIIYFYGGNLSMNKIYKLVWSKSRNCYIAVSELAKNRTKSPKSSVIARTVVAGVLATLLSGWTVSGVHATEYPVNGSNAVASGINATAWGANTTALANYSTAFGSRSLTGLYRYDGKLAAVRDFTGSGSKWCIVDIFTDKKLATDFNSYSEAMAQLTPVDYVNKEDRYLYKGEEAYLDTIVDTDGKTKYVLKRASDDEVLVIGDYFTSSVIYKYDTLAPVNGGLSFGEQTVAADSQATAFGYRTTAAGKQATAFGYHTKAFGNYALSHGYQTIAIGNGSTVFGNFNIAGQLYYNDIPVRIVFKNIYDANLDRNVTYYYLSSIEDGSLLTNGYGTFDEAYQQAETRVDSGGQQGAYATVFGNWNHASGNYSTVFGYNNISTSSYATVFGGTNKASGSYATAFGSNNYAIGTRATVFGSNNIAGGNLSYNGTPARVTWNTYTDADGKKYNRFFLASIEDDTPLTAEYETKDEAITKATVTYVDYATAFGSYSQASGTGATAFGYRNIALGAQSTAFGHDSKAIANYSIAIGSGSEARGNDSIAIIGGKVATAANYSAAIGKDAEATLNHTVALGSDSVTTSKSGLDTAYLRNGTTGTAWISNRNAIAVGNDDTVTRQITGVAAGSKDTDAANVAQLKRLGNRDASNIGSNFGGTDAQNKANSQAWGTALGTGSVASGNKELVTGGTAYTELRPADNGNYVKTASTTAQNLKALDTKIGSAASANGTFAKTDNTVNANIKALDTAAANAIKSMTANGKTITYTKGDGTTGTVAINGTGTVSSGNTELINGGTAYTELRPADGTYVKQANTTAANLTALDKQTKANTDGLAAEITNRTNADTALSNRIGTLSADGNYIKKDNSAAQNLKAIDDKIGAASVANGTYINTANTVNANLKALDTGLNNVNNALDQEIDERIAADTALSDKIDNAISDIIDTGLDFGANSGDDVTNKLGSKVSIVGGGTKEDSEYDNKNIKTVIVQDENGNTEIEIDLDKNPEFASILTEGNATIGGNLSVAGKSDFGDAVSIQRDLTVEGDSYLKGDAHVYQNLQVDGDANISGNTTLEKDLEVLGNSNIHGNGRYGGDLTVEGDSNLEGNAHVYQNLQVDGDTNISGNTTLEKDLTVKGDSNLEGNAHVYQNLQVDGDTNISGNTILEKDLKVEGESNLKGDTHIYKNLQVDGDTNISGNTILEKDLKVEGESNLKGDTHIYKNLQVDGDTDISGNTTIEKNLTVKGDSNLEGNAHVYQNLQVDGDTNISGNTTLEKDLTVKGDSNLEGNAHVYQNLQVDGDTNISGNTTIKKDLEVLGNSSIHGNGRYGGDLTVDGNSNLKGNAHVEKNLTVDGNANVGGILTADKVVANDIQLPGGSLNRRMDNMDTRIDKVGAGAAALAGLQYAEFDPGSKFSMAMGMGHYKGKTAAAVGGQYHFSRNVSMNLAGTIGNGENMVSAGLTFRFGAPRAKYQKDNNEALRAENDMLNKRLKAVEKKIQSLSLITEKRAAFPDVEKSHWANKAVETLHGNGFIKGYEDGNFKGNRQMTRYEYAEMLYNALSQGAKVDQAQLDEYAPELHKVNADRIRRNEHSR